MPERSKVYGILDGRRWSVSSRNQRTPLIDVLLVLIIVFMVVVAMDKEYVEKAQIPQPDQKQTAEPAIAHYRDPDRVDY